MPSSRAIRSQLGPALNSLKNQLVTANQLLANYQNNHNLDQVRAARFQLNRTLDRVDSLQGKWAHFLDSLEGDDLAHEENFMRDSHPEQREIQTIIILWN